MSIRVKRKDGKIIPIEELSLKETREAIYFLKDKVIKNKESIKERRVRIIEEKEGIERSESIIDSCNATLSELTTHKAKLQSPVKVETPTYLKRHAINMGIEVAFNQTWDQFEEEQTTL